MQTAYAFLLTYWDIVLTVLVLGSDLVLAVNRRKGDTYSERVWGIVGARPWIAFWVGFLLALLMPHVRDAVFYVWLFAMGHLFWQQSEAYKLQALTPPPAAADGTG